MKILVDTHVWLWAQVDPDRIQPDARALIEAQSTELLLSAARAWEIAIKHAIGKLALPEPPDVYVPEAMRASATTALAVTVSHALRVARLPFHHNDPFDRVLIAQAQAEGLPILTADPVFKAYSVELIPADARSA